MSGPMRLLVCGGRDFADKAFAFAALDHAHSRRSITCIIHGGAAGADTIAGEWAASRGVPVQVFSADWRKHGKAAGPIRNQQMLDEGRPDGVVAFKGGRGTADMTTRAAHADLPIWWPQP